MSFNSTKIENFYKYDTIWFAGILICFYICVCFTKKTEKCVKKIHLEEKNNLEELIKHKDILIYHNKNLFMKLMVLKNKFNMHNRHYSEYESGYDSDNESDCHNEYHIDYDSHSRNKYDIDFENEETLINQINELIYENRKLINEIVDVKNNLNNQLIRVI